MDTLKPEWALKLVGMPEAEAADFIRSNGYTYRLVSKDGQAFAGTCDFRTDRINVILKEGVVAGWRVG